MIVASRATGTRARKEARKKRRQRSLNRLTEQQEGPAKRPTTTARPTGRPKKRKTSKAQTEEPQKEEDKEVRGKSKIKIRILNLKRHLSKNSIWENYCIEHEGMVQGLMRATELVEQAIGKQENHTTPPRSSPLPEC